MASTTVHDLNDQAWTLIADVDIDAISNIGAALNSLQDAMIYVGTAAPNLSDEGVVLTPDRMDSFSISALTSGSKVWARAVSQPVRMIVVAY